MLERIRVKQYKLAEEQERLEKEKRKLLQEKKAEIAKFGMIVIRLELYDWPAV
jgi:hypothetical protein